jgi:uncharacterized protein YdhG (YjbR/CyaY superfamily)
MTMKRSSGAAAGSIDEYIERQPQEVRQILSRLRKTIRAAAPKAEETISYQIPTFKFHGNLVHFAAWKTHIGFYPTSSGIRQFSSELQSFTLKRGTIQFPLDRPIPYGLIAQIVRFRAKENRARAEAKK